MKSSVYFPPGFPFELWSDRASWPELPKGLLLLDKSYRGSDSIIQASPGKAPLGVQIIQQVMCQDSSGWDLSRLQDLREELQDLKCCETEPCKISGPYLDLYLSWICWNGCVLVPHQPRNYSTCPISTFD